MPEPITITLNNNKQDQITGIPSSITINQGQASTAFTITATNDQTPEETQTITITLSEVQGLAQIGDAKQATITIPANDTPILTITPTTLTVEEGQIDQLTITAKPTPIDIITVTITNSDAKQIQTTPTMLMLSPATTQVVIDLSAINDSSAEEERTYTLGLRLDRALPN